jgi:hypothetical protein
MIYFLNFLRINKMDIESITFLICIFLITLIILLFYFVYENKKTLKSIQETNTIDEIKVNNLIDAVNFNDKILYNQQQYIHSLYNSNASFNIVEHSDEGNNRVTTEPIDDTLHYDMMKNYDALTSITK